VATAVTRPQLPRRVLHLRRSYQCNGAYNTQWAVTAGSQRVKG